MESQTKVPDPRDAGSRYEPTAVESVLTPDELEREVHYAGKETLA